MGEICINGARIKTLREWRNWTQGQLAYKAGTTSAQISRIENNERPGAQAVLVGRIAKALDTSVDYLLGLTDFSDPVKWHVQGFEPEQEHILRWFFERAQLLAPEQQKRTVDFITSIIEFSQGSPLEVNVVEDSRSEYEIPTMTDDELERDLLEEFRRLPPEWQQEAIQEVERLQRLRVRFVGEDDEEEVENSPQEESYGQRHKA